MKRWIVMINSAHRESLSKCHGRHQFLKNGDRFNPSFFCNFYHPFSQNPQRRLNIIGQFTISNQKSNRRSDIVGSSCLNFVRKHHHGRDSTRF